MTQSERGADQPEANEVTMEPGLWEVLHEDRQLNGFMRPGGQALLMYRLGRWASRRPRQRWPILWLAALMQFFVRNIYGIELYWESEIGRRLLISHQGNFVLHRFCKIGNDCVIRQGVTIGTSEGLSSGGEAAILGNNVRVGVGATILGNIRIGDNVRIGPNAVVTTDVPENSTVLAPPSRIIPWA